MSLLLLIPGILQAFVILMDEFIFHHQRGLPTWEIWGHPLDTLTVILAFGCLIFFPNTPLNIGIYTGLAVFSCAFITKDEFVHTKLCKAGEHWLHSLLFVLHPVSFYAFASLWLKDEYRHFLVGQFAFTFAFMIYQILYWGKPWQIFRPAK